MFILFEITIILINNANALEHRPFQITSQVKDEINFNKKGKIASNLQEGHIMIDLDLKFMLKGLKTVNFICNQVEAMVKDPRYKKIKENLVMENRTCKAYQVKMMDRQMEVYNIFVREYYIRKRQKRFIGLAAGFLLGAVGTYSIEQLIGMRDTFRLNTNQEKIFTIIQGHEARITKMEEQIDNVNRTLKRTIILTNEIINSVEAENHVSQLMLIVQMEFYNHDDRTGALLDLVNGLINPTLLKTTTIKKAIKILKRKAEDRGLTIPLQRIEEVYQFPNSYVYNNGTISIFMHIPLVDSKMMNLYQLEPIILNITKGFSGIVDEINYIAVTEDETAFKIFTPQELDHCTKLNPEHYFCLHNVMLRDFSAYCISSLYKAELVAAHQGCKVGIVPQGSWAKQLSKDTFLTYVRNKTTLKISCAKKDYIEVIEGVNKIHIPSCTAVSKTFELFGQREEMVELLSISKPMKWNIPEITHGLSEGYIEQIMKEMRTSHPVHVADLRKQYNIEGVYHWYWHVPAYILLFGIITFLILACYCIFKFEKKSREKRKARRANLESRQNIELSIREAVQSPTSQPNNS